MKKFIAMTVFYETGFDTYEEAYEEMQDRAKNGNGENVAVYELKAYATPSTREITLTVL